jgi:hypothetical protein
MLFYLQINFTKTRGRCRISLRENTPVICNIIHFAYEILAFRPAKIRLSARHGRWQSKMGLYLVPSIHTVTFTVGILHVRIGIHVKTVLEMDTLVAFSNGIAQVF